MYAATSVATVLNTVSITSEKTCVLTSRSLWDLIRKLLEYPEYPLLEEELVLAGGASIIIGSLRLVPPKTQLRISGMLSVLSRVKRSKLI